MSIFNKTFVKFAVGFGAIIFVAIGFVVYGGAGKYLQERAAKKAIAEYEAKLAADTYGGKTPEETLTLFIAALKKGDVELASKYYVLEKQGEWRQKLQNIKDSNLLLSMISDLSRKSTKRDINEKNTNFYIANDSNVLALIIRMSFNQYSKVWKIESL